MQCDLETSIVYRLAIENCLWSSEKGSLNKDDLLRRIIYNLQRWA